VTAPLRHDTLHSARRPATQRIAIVTDAWAPQMNGVVRTLTATVARLEARGHDIMVIAPDQFRSLPCPTYPEIRLALARAKTVARRLTDFAPDAIHIATEGPLGLIARRLCVTRQWPFTTAYHTQFPAYVARRTHLPERLFWRYIRWFHRPATRIMVATSSIRGELGVHGLTNVHHWSRGVDLTQFTQAALPPEEYEKLERPIQLYAGRVAVEKNIEAFLDAPHIGSKVVVGDGPALADLAARYPAVSFLGRRDGAALAGCYAGADVFVFPSRTDTFGLVIIEALACGTPVAAFPVAGPLDIVTERCGALSEDLSRAIDAALFCERADCAAEGARFSWDAATDQFVAGLVGVPESVGLPERLP
jgi:glycosyltransferase involved in cell wall biosynthesis